MPCAVLGSVLEEVRSMVAVCLSANVHVGEAGDRQAFRSCPPPDGAIALEDERDKEARR
jgi:hypothetical protein